MDTGGKTTADRPNSIDGKEIKKKIFNYARDFAFEKITKSLDKKMAKETVEDGIGGGEVQVYREVKKTKLQQQQQQRHKQYDDDDDDDDDEDGNVVAVSSQRESRQCQTYITNERRISGWQQQQQHHNAGRRNSNRMLMLNRSSSIVTPPTRLLPGSASKGQDKAAIQQMHRMENEDNDNYQTADDLDDDDDDGDNEDNDDSDEYSGDERRQVLLRDSKNYNGRPVQYRKQASVQYYDGVADNDKKMAAVEGMPNQLNTPGKNALGLLVSNSTGGELVLNNKSSAAKTTTTTAQTQPGGSSAVDYSGYIQKKSFAQGMMDLALLSANTNQLRYIIEYRDQHPYFGTSFALVCSSLFLQVAVGLSLIWNTRLNLKKRNEMKEADRANNFGVIGIFLVTLINVFLSTFSGSPGGATGPKETMMATTVMSTVSSVSNAVEVTDEPALVFT